MNSKVKEAVYCPPSHERFLRFLTLWHAGFNLIPSRSDNRKKPRIEWKILQTERQRTLELSNEFFKDTSCNFFLITGFRPWDDLGVVVADGDDQDGMKLIESRCPPTPLTVSTGREGGGKHYYFRHPGKGVRVKQVIKLCFNGNTYNVDIKGDGGYAVAPGSIHASGREYRGSVPITAEVLSNLPVWNPDWLPEDKTKVTTLDLTVYEEKHGSEESPDHDGNHLPSVADRVSEAKAYLQAVPGTTAGQGKADSACYALANTFVHGFALPEEEAVELLMTWAERDDQLDAEGGYFPWTEKQIRHKVYSAVQEVYKGTLGDRLNGMKRLRDEETRAEAERIYREISGSRGVEEVIAEEGEEKPWDFYAEELRKAKIPFSDEKVSHGEKRYVVLCNCGCEVYGAFFVNQSTYEAGYRCGNGRKSWAEAKTLWTEKDQRESRKRRGYKLDELDGLPVPEWLVENHFHQNGLIQLYGPSGVGKTFISLDMSLCVSTGKPFLGVHKVNKGAVCYVVGEGSTGINKRIKVWRQFYGYTGKIDNFVVVPAQFDLTPEGKYEVDDIMRIVDESLEEAPVLIVLDTLNRHFGSGNENDTKDMTGFVKSCDLLRKASGAAVLPIHHTGLDSTRERGNITLRNACDTIIACESWGTGLGMTVRCRKQKDDIEFADYVVRKQEVKLTETTDSLVFTLDETVLVEPEEKVSKLQQWKNDEDMVLHFAGAYEGADKATTKANFVDYVQKSMRLVEMEPAGENRIRRAISSLVDLHKLAETESSNPNHRKVYLPRPPYVNHGGNGELN